MLISLLLLGAPLDSFSDYQSMAKELNISQEVLEKVDRRAFEFVEHKLTDATAPFEIQRTEVTQVQWYLVMHSNISSFQKRGYGSINASNFEVYNEDYFKFQDGVEVKLNRPMESVSIQNIDEFLRRLNLKSRDYQYRLPTLNEWRYSARANADEKQTEDSMPSVAVLNLNSDTGATRPSKAPMIVGSKKPNAFGLFDVIGNVWEWTSSREIVKDPRSSGPSDRERESRVAVGCSFRCSAGQIREVDLGPQRFIIEPRSDEYRDSDLGFRLARTRK